MVADIYERNVSLRLTWFSLVKLFGLEFLSGIFRSGSMNSRKPQFCQLSPLLTKSARIPLSSSSVHCVYPLISLNFPKGSKIVMLLTSFS